MVHGPVESRLDRVKGQNLKLIVWTLVDSGVRVFGMFVELVGYQDKLAIRFL